MPVPLHTLEVLAVDCQATAAYPRGDLLEVGWARASASRSPAAVESHVVSPPPTARLTRRLRELTGLTNQHLRMGLPREHVGARLAEVVSAARRRPAPFVGVAHFARFEQPFLRQLLSSESGLELDLLCTHEIARRLLPDLPRRGLRAVAGYLGHGVGELRRAGPHVTATCLVWRGLVSLLDEAHGIRDLDALRSWLDTPTPRRGRRAYPMDSRTRLDLPDEPGVYRFQRTDGSVLYVGKATSLRQRVNTYFQTSRGHRDRTLEMLAQARAVDVTPTATPLEAALLEPDEIKRLHPPYNVALRERDRRVAFWSWSLRRSSARPDERHPVGPFLVQGPRPPLSALLELLDRGGGARDAERLAPSVLGVPRRYGPGLAPFRAGLGLFVERHGRWWRVGSPVRALRSLASTLRRSAEEVADDQDEERADTLRWTPEAVAAGLESVVLRGAHVLGRARWLMALSECTVGWDPGRETARCLVMRGGAVAASQDRPLTDLPVPPGHATTLRERQETVNLAAYDRLSVLSRELKTLVASGRPVVVSLGPDTCLGRDRLGRALRCL